MRRVSRRKAMAILGSGYVAGIVLTPEEAEAQACGQNAVASVVQVPKVTLAGATVQGHVLRSISCCQESKAAFIAGANSRPPKERNHLRAVVKQLSVTDASPEADILEEYCLMVFGLSKLPKGKDAYTIEQAVNRMIETLYAGV